MKNKSQKKNSKKKSVELFSLSVSAGGISTDYLLESTWEISINVLASPMMVLDRMNM